MEKMINMTIQDDGMAFITLNSPPVNALSRALIAEMLACVNQLASDNQVRVMLLTSNCKHFCAGLDLKEQADLGREDAAKAVQEINTCLNAIAALPFPTISVLKGAAMGGGAELSLSTDFRIMADSGRIGFPEVGLSLIPGAGGTQRLPRLIGPARAKYWIFSAVKFTAEEALADGVVDFLAEDDDLLEMAIELGQEFINNGPLGIRAAKKAIDSGLALPLIKGLKCEQDAFESTLDTEDHQEALKAFMEKRPPQWQGR